MQIAIGQWRHVVVKSEGDMKIYIDCEVMAELTVGMAERWHIHSIPATLGDMTEV